VPAARIIEREVQGPPRLVEKIKYVYLQPDVRATAPRGATEDAARFCRPITVAQTDTVRAIPSAWLIRSVNDNPSWIPLAKDGLDAGGVDALEYQSCRVKARVVPRPDRSNGGTQRGVPVPPSRG